LKAYKIGILEFFGENLTLIKWEVPNEQGREKTNS